ncbi:Na+/H+ antiporter NhaD/arsenite permease-like protein [Actinoplanes octamycinicus]|uniref:Na+/H+ antiporter NhaD/arsenite permease-like protein n=1 Tax=Actinoplanes octamycinicus TaxID=135948 RepID=A0A7W7M9N2_9ACTN|nr:ArsB/NhaD family transporter [Actinoplanes octamycinicus]MBB4742203.1 Na+/H+ antiporter NhaD/arsenite permease-like protein [Actinoplanes octamycinicus]GIE59951.1 membrane protein [Actinoplanes octamycinicus]
MSVIAWTAVVVFVAAYVLIATEKLNRVTVALGGAAIMLAVGATDAEHAFFSEEAGIDWNVIFLLLGMMLIVGVLKRTGVFEYVAIWSAKKARARPFPIMVILIVVTGLVSGALDNVTTVLLVAPVTLLVCDRLGVPPVPFLLAEVFASNIGGTGTLVGDPPNIIIASRSGLTFNDFLVVLGPFVLLVLVVLVLLCRILFREAFRYDPDRTAQIMALRERDAIRDPRLLVISLGVLAVVLVAFVLHPVLGLEPSVVALLGGLLLLALSRLDATEVAQDVEWPTLVFFAGLFVMVGGLVATGVIDEIAQAAATAVEGKLWPATMLLLWASAALSAIVDNIPYVATMSPIVAELVNAEGGLGHAQVLWWALAIGADFGGNATAVGASANVVVLGIAARAGHKITFWEFTKYGLIVTVITVALAVPYLWLRFFAL